MEQLWQAVQRATTGAEPDAAIQPTLGKTGLMQIRRVRSRIGYRASHIQNGSSGHWKSSHHGVKWRRACRTPVPVCSVTVLVDDDQTGCIFCMTDGQSLGSLRDEDALSVARDLDAKVEDVLRQAA